jgi:hypothetical protein
VYHFRYIENLKADKPTITDFGRTLRAHRANTTPLGTVPASSGSNANSNSSSSSDPPPGSLPYHWLADSDPKGSLASRHGSLTGALWALRKHMVRDAFRFKKVLFPALDGPNNGVNGE